ncbi:Hypothetical protein A7982_10489 [Minicystis rosea]|nr:Hypothetical protein A7982_10489 [Minicystis rosea]
MGRGHSRLVLELRARGSSATCAALFVRRLEAIGLYGAAG